MRGWSPYHRLSASEKQLEHRARMREPAVRCPCCEVETTVGDLLGHVEQRCTGRSEPHPLSRWIEWRDALSLGVSPWTLSRWTHQGLVRSRAGERQRQYLLRDLVVRLAERRPWLRRRNWSSPRRGRSGS